MKISLNMHVNCRNKAAHLWFSFSRALNYDLFLEIVSFQCDCLSLITQKKRFRVSSFFGDILKRIHPKNHAKNCKNYRSSFCVWISTVFNLSFSVFNEKYLRKSFDGFGITICKNFWDNVAKLIFDRILKRR